MSFFEWLAWLLWAKAPGRVTNVQFKVDLMARTIAVTWDLPAIRDDGSPMPKAEADFTEVFISPDLPTKAFVLLAKIEDDTAQTVTKDIADGAYLFRFVVTGTNAKKGKPVDFPVTVSTPAPGVVTNIKVTVSG